MEDLIKALNIKELRYANIEYIDNNGNYRILKFGTDCDFMEMPIVKESEVTD